MSYCDYCQGLPEDNHHKIYHDFHYGIRVKNDNELFERLVLEINQAGLNWDTILRKQENFKRAYSNFDIEKVANYTELDIERLMLNPGIIRNRLKINAAIYNANAIVFLQKEHGSFLTWLDLNKSKNRLEWLKLFKTTFKFTGGEIVNEFLMSLAFLPGAHQENCVKYKEIQKAKSTNFINTKTT